jgi:hypothetical protein
MSEQDQPPTTFWLVWCPERGEPARRHATYFDAKAEALRLALKHGGKTFHVCVAVGMATAGEAHYVECVEVAR